MCIIHLLSQVKLEDVFKSTQENMNQAPGSERVLALVLGALAILILLLVIHQRRSQQAVPRSVNHHGKLLKEVTRVLPIKSAEVKCLKQAAEEQSCSSPLVLLLCPSLLTKSINADQEKRNVLAGLAKKIGG